MKCERFLRCSLAALILFIARAPMAATTGEAFGAPGITAMHGPARKSFLGTALNPASRIYFTGYRGIVSEIYYPVLDTTETVDLQFLIGDAAASYVDEEKLQDYSATRTDARTMSWQVKTQNDPHNWRIIKTIFSDPTRNALIERVTFQALNGAHIGDYRLYLLFKPHLDNAGENNIAWTATAANGRIMLAGRHNSRYSALAVSLPWQTQDGTPMLSNGFVGQSDGWTDLLGGASPDRKMDWTYASATNGNVAQIGWIDTSNANATSVSFDVVLAFDSASPANAMQTANATLADNLDTLSTQYDAAWHAYAAGLTPQNDDTWYLAAMTLKTMQDKSNGAMIAGIGTPWGETQNDGNAVGYHIVWARDLFKFANALITANDTATATIVAHYLFDKQQQKEDCGASEFSATECLHGYSRVGRFPQNSWVDGTQNWSGTQMDEQAMPILLAWRLGPSVYNALWPQIRLTADYILGTGPWTQQERWEEASGYSPSTIAAEIAGLVAAARIALDNGDAKRAGAYLSAADYWQQNVTRWTYTDAGQLGTGHFYVRVNPAGMSRAGSGPQQYEPTSYPVSDQRYDIANGGGNRSEDNVVDGGFLELVRMGVKRADDPTIVSTLAVYDAVLKTTFSDTNPAWFRYNFDGYGERNDGSDFSNTGVGRAWPIFTAERGMFEIARSGRGDSGKTYLAAVRRYATPEGFIPEQIWTTSKTLPDDWNVTTPAPYTPETPTKSIAPLNWAMGEYISLVASIAAGKIVDIPMIVCARYSNCVAPPKANERSVAINVNAATQPGQYMYVTGNADALGNWNTDLGVPVDPASYPIWRNNVNLPSGKSVQYKYYRKNADGTITWEDLGASGNRRLTVPASGKVSLNDRVNW